jgi:murein DD-endopeptidase MepM/ murein hydrolase activator NlpD
MLRVLPIVALGGMLLLAPGASQGSPPARGPHAVAVRILVPGHAPVESSRDGAFVYPADGSTVQADSTSSIAAAGAASAELESLSVFDGDIGVDAVTADLASGGDVSGSSVDGLTVLGLPVRATPGERIPLADWGYAVVLAERPGHVTALDVVLTAAHDGLPAGSELQFGDASGVVAVPTITIAPVVSRPPTVTPTLGESGYAFPVYGSVAWGDTFGAARPDVSGGWHHGDDIFAPLGTPVLAVAHGVVFSVGWEKIGGRRLWLRDDRGNEFYYAHLSAYSPLAVNGAIVNAGDVLGFVGDTGDAEGTPYHLHFEVHPLGLLDRGYDGAVDPTSYLSTWRHPKVLRFEAGAGWTPTVLSGHAPKAGAVLLHVALDRALASR